MEWTDDGLMLGAKPFGETGALAEIFTRSHGRAAALVYGGASRRIKPLLQPGNAVSVTWKGRTGEQLGFFAPLELNEPHAARLMHDAAALTALTAAIALIRAATPERQAFPGLFDAMSVLVNGLAVAEVWPALYTRFELGLLTEVGYGLDLSRCAITGAVTSLAWVSPKTGRAACAAAGAPYSDKLLVLPPFLVDAEAEIASGDVADAFALTGFFLDRRVFDPQGQGMPDARRRLIELLGHAGRL
jgi:DNA repair protein RecO (recombination protein O)